MKIALSCVAVAIMAATCCTSAKAADFQKDKGGVWKATFSHEEVKNISDAAGVLAMGVPAPFNVIIAGCVTGIQATDAIGGNRGVTVVGVGPSVTFITPPQASPYDSMANLDEKTINKLNEHIGQLCHVFEAETDKVKNDLDSAYRKIFGGGKRKADAQRPKATDDIGDLEAKSKSPNENTEFLIAYLKDGKVGILTPAGWIQAAHGGGEKQVGQTKIRDVPGEWETWEIETWSDGSVSFVTKGRKWRLAASNDGDVWTDVPYKDGDLQEVAKFALEFGANGRVRLFSHHAKAYISVK